MLRYKLPTLQLRSLSTRRLPYSHSWNKQVVAESGTGFSGTLTVRNTAKLKLAWKVSHDQTLTDFSPDSSYFEEGGRIWLNKRPFVQKRSFLLRPNFRRNNSWRAWFVMSFLEHKVRNYFPFQAPGVKNPPTKIKQRTALHFSIVTIGTSTNCNVGDSLPLSSVLPHPETETFLSINKEQLMLHKGCTNLNSVR